MRELLLDALYGTPVAVGLAVYVMALVFAPMTVALLTLAVLVWFLSAKAGQQIRRGEWTWS
jgi:hypothetical protein